MANQRHAIRAVQIYRNEMCNDLVVDYLLDHLVETDIFTEEDKEMIVKSGDSIGDIRDLSVRDRVLRKQNETFVDLLLKKMEIIDHTFQRLTYILFKHDNYPWIAKRLLCLRDDDKKMEEMNQRLSQLDLLNTLPKRIEVIEQHLTAIIGKPLDLSFYLYDKDNNVIPPDTSIHKPMLTISDFRLKDDHKCVAIDNKIVIKDIVIREKLCQNVTSIRETTLEIYIPSVYCREFVTISVAKGNSGRPLELFVSSLYSNGLQDITLHRNERQSENETKVKLKRLGEDMTGLSDELIEQKRDGYKQKLIELQLKQINRKARGVVVHSVAERDGVLGRVAHLAYVEDDDMAKSISWFLRNHMTCIVTKTSLVDQSVCSDILVDNQQTLSLDSIPEQTIQLPQLPSNPSISVKFAKYYLILNEMIADLDKVFATLLGNTLVIEDIEIAKRYRQLVIADMRCPTIITKSGILYESGVVDLSLGTNIVMFQSPPNPDINRFKQIEDLLHNLLFLHRKCVNQSTNGSTNAQQSPNRCTNSLDRQSPDRRPLPDPMPVSEPKRLKMEANK